MNFKLWLAVPAALVFLACSPEHENAVADTRTQHGGTGRIRQREWPADDGVGRCPPTAGRSPDVRGALRLDATSESALWPIVVLRLTAERRMPSGASLPDLGIDHANLRNGHARVQPLRS